MVKQSDWQLISPDGRLNFKMELEQGRLYYKIDLNDETMIRRSRLGAKRNDTDLSEHLVFTGPSELLRKTETVQFLTGKQLELNVESVARTFSFENEQNKMIEIQVMIINGGVAIRYGFPGDSTEEVTVMQDLMEFSLPENSRSWLQPYDRITRYTPAYEWYFHNGAPAGLAGNYGNGWCFPALFNTSDNWILLSEAGIDGNYSGSHLDNQEGSSTYTLRWPEESEANSIGSSQPSDKLPWQTSWKTIITGDLNTIVKSDFVKILSPASRIKDTSWIKPGRVSWSWLSDHPSPKDFNKLISFIDLAADMNWEYSLVDANWNSMTGGTIEQLVQYANQKQVGILMWYNSGGPHNEVTEEPRDIMNDRSTRREEFSRLHNLGVKGVKIDFFQSDKEFVMEMYRQILEDAADFNIMVNFHGCTIPRGWSRTYPNLITMESVRGGECYSFDQFYAAQAPELNTILPFTRNVIGSMDYTPVIFNDYVTPHFTSSGHEIALSVVFESGWLHFGDGREAYRSLGEIENSFLSGVPVTWDQVELIRGMPGQEVIIARRKEENWYIAGINGEDKNKSWTIDLSRFGDGFQVTKIRDGNYPDQLISSVATESGPVTIDILPYGGFALKLELR